MIEKLRKINNKLLNLSSNKEDKEKYFLIAKILSDDKAFFKMNMENAYAILRDLTVKEENIEGIYKELVDITNY